MRTTKLTDEQAFLAMYAFLEEYYESTKSDDIGALLGSMSLLPDGVSADAAVQEEWKEAIEKVLNGHVNANLEIDNT